VALTNVFNAWLTQIAGGVFLMGMGGVLIVSGEDDRENDQMWTLMPDKKMVMANQDSRQEEPRSDDPRRRAQNDRNGRGDVQRPEGHQV
jgi:hypothetical protein